MGRVLIHAPSADRSSPNANPLPGTLQTPSGLAILEIQGTLNIVHGSDGGPEDSQPLPIGKLSFPLYDPAADPSDIAWHKRVYLFVGDNQRLTGELKKLPNPLAVIRKRTASADQMHDNEELEVAEIIYHKLSFTHRPEPFGAAQAEG